MKKIKKTFVNVIKNVTLFSPVFDALTKSLTLTNNYMVVILCHRFQYSTAMLLFCIIVKKYSKIPILSR